MDSKQKLSVGQVFLAFLKLGLTSFGGPVAHLGYFRDEFVTRRRCLQEDSYADLVALCQFLPGPASSQVGIGIGLSQAGLRGGLAAWTGFTLPSALALILFAYGVTTLQASVVEVGWLHGLKVVAVAVVAQAIWGMAKTLCPDRPRGTVAILAAMLTLAWPGVPGQLAAIGGGALLGLFWLRYEQPRDHEPQLFSLSRRSALISLVTFVALLLLLPLLGHQSQVLALVDSFYRSGALVFGGGHVVLPLLQAEVVGPGWVSKDLFLAGYGAAQAVPGPLFTFSAYLGAASQVPPNGWVGGLLCLLAIFLPSFLLVVGILPFWEGLRKNRRVRAALVGVNAAVVGLLLSAFYDPVWTSGVLSAMDFVLALAAFGLLTLWKLPPWLVVGATGLSGALLSHLPMV
ncbi:MAG: chromate efflux transporter [Desulfuromonadales bacterium]|nr:chromate efflux transporter [Desulfuromonadales bacterium]MBN2791038.1 chromate efflux transporter [Desulfuromonadales bacterium]